MRPIYDTCRLRPEVLKGELKDAVFAARLTPVVLGKADPVYGDPPTFFSRTYATSNMRFLLQEALGRLTGADPTANPVIRLETGFGGGKTHNLIALYHAANGRTPGEILARFVAADRHPAQPIRVAAVVGEDLDPVNGVRHDDGVMTYTLWGEIAYQLAGPSGYKLMEASDRAGTAPGTQKWEELFGEEPVLVLLDEIAPYLRRLKTSKEHAERAGQVAAFLKSLLEAVAALPRAVVVLTLAEASDAFGQETEELAHVLTELLSELKSVSARKEIPLTPAAGEEEIGAILVHRLFEHVDPEAGRATAQEYRDYYDRLLAQGADIPPASVHADYVTLLERGYPFHPELLIVLNRKISTIPNFQRTRGALRLLATALRQLWETRPRDAWLVQLHHLDLGVPKIVEDLTARLDRPRYRQVVQADIVSGVPTAPAHAEVIDRQWEKEGRPPLAGKVATTIFLHSLTRAGGSGARPEEINLAVLTPGDDPTLAARSLEDLERACWHLEYESGRYIFKPEPALNKMVADEAQYVGTAKAKEELDRRIRGIWQEGIFQVCHFPEEPARVPDDAGKPKLAIIHYDASTARDEDELPPEFVRRLFKEAGTAGGVRTYQNNVLFLVADGAQVASMIRATRYHLAVDRLASDPERQETLTRDQRKRLGELRGTSDLELRVAVHRVYRFLYCPSADTPERAAGLAREALPAQEQGDVRQDQTRVILESLRRLEKIYTADDPPIAPEFLRQKAWPAGRTAVTSGDLRRAFAMRRGLRMLLDHEPLRRGIKEGIARGRWIYYDPAEAMGYGAASPPPSIRLDDEVELMDLEEAARRGIVIKGVEAEVERCPVCGSRVEGCTCGEDAGDKDGEEVTILQTEGVVDQAIQRLLDKLNDSGLKGIRQLKLMLEGNDEQGTRELRSLGLAVPQLGRGKCKLEVTAVAEFAQGDDLKLVFRGPWERYRALKDATDSLFRQAPGFHARAALTIDFEPGEGTPDRLNGIREVLRALDIGRVTVKAEPEEGHD